MENNAASQSPMQVIEKALLEAYQRQEQARRRVTASNMHESHLVFAEGVVSGLEIARDLLYRQIADRNHQQSSE